ncbi:putative disease resistance protein RF45 [Heracleum sosnowskyi]|uniref:Disease resistance protein RF45 n=1 Tax=Heracleum sosnowskyi TaxID=360622 RepID=A0AAD8LY56_9APIA|nr:putative disease resistance protein RF45 [Heracleum sosnowskyi]
MMLDVAERYLDELAHRSLVKVELHEVDGESWLKYKKCVVHDLIHDLCLSKVKEERIISVIDFDRKRDEESRAIMVRRLCVRSYTGSENLLLKPYDQRASSHIRSLSVWNRRNHYIAWPGNILSLEKHKLLRVLTARGYIFSDQNMRSISELVYLKYLCLHHSVFYFLPSSIEKLRNLETLDARMSFGSLTIPNVLWKLKMLKHLYLPQDIRVRGKSKKLRLEGLNKLELIHNFNSEYCDAHDLLRLPNLKVIHGCIIVEENITSENIAEFAKSRELRHTDIRVILGRQVSMVLLLECCFIDSLNIGGLEIPTPMHVFPKVYDYARSRLSQLVLNGFKIEEDPMILLGKLPNLRHLALSTIEYLGGEIVCSAMSFLKLENLDLGGLKGLTGWRVEQGAIPKLSRLFIYECSELEMLPEGLKHLTSLKSLHVIAMSTFTDKIKVIDGVEGQDFYKIRHIPDLRISAPRIWD